MIASKLKLPNRDLEGRKFVVGVGGSTLRVSDVVLFRGTARSVELLKRGIPIEIKSGTQLFEWCAEQISALNLLQYELCLSWSFPVVNGEIVNMGKQFNKCYIGHHVVELFNKAFQNKHVITSVTHDGTASLLAGLFQQDCYTALTWGTGININFVSETGEAINSEISVLGRPDVSDIRILRREFDRRGGDADLFPLEAMVGGDNLRELVKLDPGAQLRAVRLVAACIKGLHLRFKPKNKRIACTGGVIMDNEYRKMLQAELHGLGEFELVSDEFGSEVGAAVDALVNDK